MTEINMIPGLGIAATGLTAGRRRMDAIADNIANASTTRTADGEPYRRKIVHFAAGGGVEIKTSTMDLGTRRTELAETRRGHRSSAPLPAASVTREAGVRVLGVTEDQSPFPLVYDPSHPDAGEDGFVAMPNVELLSEMVDLMLASRLYEANLAVLESSKANAGRILDLMR